MISRISEDFRSRLERRPWTVALFLVFVVLAIYSPVAMREYGFMDDYSLLNDALTAPRVIFDFCVAGGRPIYGAILEGTVGLCRNIADLRFLRLAGILSLGAASAALFLMLRHMDWPTDIAWLTALLVAFTPSAQIGAFWSIMWPTSSSIVLVVSAFLTVDRMGKEWPRRKWRALSLLGGGITLLLLAGLNYQPYLFFYAVCLLAGLLRERHPKTQIRWAAMHLVVFAFSCVAVLISFKIIQHVLGIEPLSRTALTNDPMGKLQWFFSGPLLDALAVYLIRHPASQVTWPPIVLVTFLILTGLLCACRRRGLIGGTLCTAAVLGLLPLAYGANLIVKENGHPYRTLFAVVSFVVVASVWALWEFRRTFRLIPRAVITGVLIGACLYGGVSAMLNGLFLFAKPQALELRKMRKLFKANPLRQGDAVFLLRPGWEDTIAPFVANDEFGLPSTSQFWSAEGMFWCVFREFHSEVSDPRAAVTFRSSQEKRDHVPGEIIFDMKKELRKIRRNQEDDGFG